MSATNYRGRFAPSPTGLLHAGSLATALASWLDARAAQGTWLIRLEDLDTPRVQTHAMTGILQQLAIMGMTSDEVVIYQSQRLPFYLEALHQLNQFKLLYTCSCSRKKIAQSQDNPLTTLTTELIYPGFCRPAKPESCPLDQSTGAIRVRIPTNTYLLSQHLNSEVGDFIILRQDGIFTYQLAVVVDDGLQGITHIVRGEDLSSNTPRQVWLQNQLGIPTPNYKHVPLVVNDFSEKLSKQTNAPPIWPKNTQEALEYLHLAGEHLKLGLEKPSLQMTLAQWQEQAIKAWSDLT
jgi:glutamyl-Q tRNA(Asp) synthetase